MHTQIDQFAHFFSSIADNSALYGNKSTVSKNFYVDTLNPAQVFLNYGQDVCEFTSFVALVFFFWCAFVRVRSTRACSAPP
jgi:hypothetical protein